MKNWLIAISLLAAPALATDFVFKFNSPSFNGIAQSAHYLTIDEQERSRKLRFWKRLNQRQMIFFVSRRTPRLLSLLETWNHAFFLSYPGI